jgi:hypothetical protein
LHVQRATFPKRTVHERQCRATRIRVIHHRGECATERDCTIDVEIFVDDQRHAGHRIADVATGGVDEDLSSNLSIQFVLDFYGGRRFFLLVSLVGLRCCLL